MARTVKDPEARKLEIIQTASKLFRQKGFKNTSVDAVITEMGVAKGTFYYYFKSKEDVLAAIVDHTLDQIIEMAGQVADAPSLDAMTKMKMLLSGGNMGGEDAGEVADILHLPENREMHEISNIQTVLRLSPVLAKIVAQGIKEKVFHTKRPLATIQLLLTGSQFLLDGGLFDFDEQEIAERRLVMQDVIEKSLGAEPGSFSFLDNNSTSGANHD